MSLLVVATNVKADSESPAYCSSEVLLKRYKEAYATTNDTATSIRAVLSTLDDAVKADSALSRFIVSAANGEVTKEIKTVSAVTKGYRIDPRTLRSEKLVRYFNSVELKSQPMATSLTTGYDHIALLISVANFGANLHNAIVSGDHEAKVKTAKDAFDISSTLAVTYRGWQSLSIAFNTVGFVDYALNSAIAHAYEIHEEYWWQAYRSYLDANYPKMVTGSNSWAALAVRGDKGKAFEARLTEFWSEQETSDGISTIMERAAHYYKTPGPHQRDALAGATDKFKNAFAARYYAETLKTTLDTYMQRQAESLEFEAVDKLDQATSALCDYIDEIKTLQIAVTRLQEEGADDKFKAREHFQILATRETYDGPQLSGAVLEGDIVAFSAKVFVEKSDMQQDGVEQNQGYLKWVILDSSGHPVDGAEKTTPVEAAESPFLAKFRLRFSNLDPGKYSTRLTYHPTDDSGESVSDTFDFLIGLKPSFGITRLWITDEPDNETHIPVLSPDQTPVFYVTFEMGEDLESVKRTFVVRDLASNAIIVSEEGEKWRKGDQSLQRTGFLLPAGTLQPAGQYRFEATLTAADGKSLSGQKKFEVAEGMSAAEKMAVCHEAQQAASIAEQSYSAFRAEYVQVNQAFHHRVENEKAGYLQRFKPGPERSRHAVDIKLFQSVDLYDKVFDLRGVGCIDSVTGISESYVGRNFHYDAQSVLPLCNQLESAELAYRKAQRGLEQLKCSSL